MEWSLSETAKKQWDEWNLRVVVLISLFLQILLIFSANSRRNRSNTTLTAAIWSFYLLADWIAAFAVGLISTGETNNCPKTTVVNRQLAAFWAPFLLLHLGGPDAITAFSLEDNQLWIRHLLGLLVQVAVVLYAFLQSLQNEYWIPTVLMFFAGAWKYAERTVFLYRACLGNFKTSLLTKPNPRPNYAQLMAEYSAMKDSGVPVAIKVENEPNNDSVEIKVENEPNNDSVEIKLENEPNKDSDGDLTIEEENPPEKRTIILRGYELFVNHMFNFHKGDNNRNFFIGKKANEAFQVMEVELNFMYDVLYTKMAVVHSRTGYLCRLLCTALIGACSWQFASHPHHNIRHLDKIISYILLGGAVVLELVGLLNLVFSDWVIVCAREEVSRLLMRLPFNKRDKRWCNIMFQHSFISFTLMEHHCGWLNKIAEYIGSGLEDMLIEIQYKEEEECLESLKNFVFNELANRAQKNKAKKATTAESTKKMYWARGAHILDDFYSTQDFDLDVWNSLSDEAEYDESLILWHIATELCYFTSTDSDGDRKVCKLLSDYMLYLMVMRPTLMSTVAATAEVRFQDTCAEAKRFFKGLQWGDDDQRRQACRELLAENTVAKLKEVKGNSSISLLFDACILAKTLNNMGDKWNIMSRVWVELLSYAASRCGGADHARQLAKGGEFITFVWLLMVHFGLVEQLGRF